MTTLSTDQGLVLQVAGDPGNLPSAMNSLVVSPASSSMESRLVKRYLSAVDRTTRNPTPQTGELSFRADGPNYEWYNGTAWVDIQKGFVAENVRSVGSGTFTTLETIIDTITFTAIAGVRYKLTWIGNGQSSATDLLEVRMRYQAGPALTTAGTLFYNGTFAVQIAGKSVSLAYTKTVTGIAAGQTTIGVGMFRSAGGTGTVQSFASATSQAVLLLEIV